ncbi:MAG TPA: ATP-binding protein [Desulfobulbaceae bacterium]|nr:ATP-binding protein [Desulfobulbaceae bacterium]
MNLTLGDVRHVQWGFAALLRLYSQAESCRFEDIAIDLSGTSWFDADMCAAFGALLYRLTENLNTVSLVNIRPGVEKILSKNGFLCHYGREQIVDCWRTTIPYQRFDVKDDRYFAGYIEEQFIHRAEIPHMSTGLLKKFRESIFEIFSNAVLHSGTEQGIFSCGQFFPKRNRLDFAVADLGIGIPQKVREYLKRDIPAVEAIQWATLGRNTTKNGAVPGGLGLKLLQEFIDLNGGSIQIVSDVGYWQRANRTTSINPLDYPFPGTVVTIEINTADTNSYALVSELSAADIF